MTFKEMNHLDFNPVAITGNGFSGIGVQSVKKAWLIFLAVLVFAVQPCFGTDYYASPSGSSGDGSKGNPWGPAEIDWGTLDNADNTLYLFGGTWSSKLEITHNTTSHTLTIRPCSASPDPSGCDTLVNIVRLQFGADAGSKAEYVTIDGEKTVGACSGKTLKDTTCRWIKTPSVGQRGYFSTQALNVKVKYLEVTGLNDLTYSQYAINLTDYFGAGLEVAYNYLHDNTGHSDIVANATPAAYGGGLIHHNYIERGTTNFIFGPSGCDVYNNYFDSTGMTAYPTGNLYDIVHIMAGPDLYIRFYNNDFVGCAEQTIFFENASSTGNKTTKVRIFNNVFNCYWETAPLDFQVLAIENIDYVTGVDDFYVVNNTFANSPGGNSLRLYGNAGGDPLTNFKVMNNIFYNNASDIGTGGSGTFPGIASDTETDAVLDYNLFYGASGFIFTWANAAHNGATNYTSIATFNTDHATINHNVSADPAFTSSTNFHLTSGSPAAAKTGGADLSALSDMPAGWPFDKDGITITGTWSMGPYKYYETGSIHGITSMGVSRQ